MNGYLLDTNVVSALRRPKVFPQVARWVRSLPDDCMWVSVISMGEVRNGIERKLRSDLEQGRVLESWYETLQPFYGDKILPVDLEIGPTRNPPAARHCRRPHRRLSLGA